MIEISESAKNDTTATPNAAELNVPQTHRERRKSAAHFSGNGFGGTNRSIIAVIVYMALLLDNILLTVIVPILPDYLANINNPTVYARVDRNVSRKIGSQLPHRIIFQPAAQLAYRYRHLVGTVSPQSTQAVMTKHPIPGKSMVNFSTLNPLDDRTTQNSLAYEQTQQQLQEQQHQYMTFNGNNNSSDVINIVPSSSFVNLSSNSSMQQVILTTTPSPPNSKSNIDTNTNSSLADENGSIGLLLSMKAFVQLIFNPIVGNLSSKFGYRLPIVLGTFCLLISSLVFGVGESYMTLLLGRAIQGIGSACIGVCGMSLVAQHYPEEDRRSKVMGIILGSIALGVLIGYPFGGFLYDISGKSAPFIILSSIIFLNIGMQLIVIDLSVQPEVIVDVDQEKPKWKPLFQSKMILAIIVAIWFSTSTMAILEPCLPIWLIQYLKPSKWQLGTVFIPDSVGYFVGTNFFGSIAYKYGQVKISCISLLLVGISAIMIPNAKSVAQLLLPHFCLGLGIGIIDAALVPLLATFVDATLAQNDSNDADCNSDAKASMSSYGTVYCLQQTSVSLAYFLAPLIGGELAEAFGFSWLMRIVGIFNIVYGPILVYLYQKYDPKNIREKHNEMLLINRERGGSQYKQLYNSIDAE